MQSSRKKNTFKNDPEMIRVTDLHMIRKAEGSKNRDNRFFLHEFSVICGMSSDLTYIKLESCGGNGRTI